MYSYFFSPKIAFTNIGVVLLCPTTKTVLPFVALANSSENKFLGSYDSISKFCALAVGVAVCCVRL